MAKRKRLSPAPAFEISGSDQPEGGLETKAMYGRIGLRPGPPPDVQPDTSARGRAPIADVAGDAAAQSAFEEVAGELQSARKEGRMVLRLPLDAVEAGHLVRDRVAVDADDMATLMDSLRARGQQAPIEVVELGGGRYGLISGWRRLMALQALHEEGSQEGRFATVQALVRSPESAAEAYCAMVEENEIRADLSFYERARIAVKAVEQGVHKTTKDAVQSLFSAARPAKRSKIMAFTALVETLDDHLRFPRAIPEKLGLRLVQALREDAGFRRRLTEALRKASRRDTPEAERRVLERVLSGDKTPAATKTENLTSGVTLTAGSGRVTLSGAAVDAELIADLRRWLRARA